MVVVVGMSEGNVKDAEPLAVVGLLSRLRLCAATKRLQQRLKLELTQHQATLLCQHS